VARVRYDGGRSTQYGMAFGAGMIRRAVSMVHRVFPKGQQGAFGAGTATLTLVARAALRDTGGVLTPDKIQIFLDGDPVKDGEFHLAVATPLRRLFWGINPFWGTGSGGLRVTCIASDARRFMAAAPGVLRGRPRPWVTPENGYTSRNVELAQLQMGCGFTLDGEIFDQRSSELVTLTPDRRVSFVRA